MCVALAEMGSVEFWRVFAGRADQREELPHEWFRSLGQGVGLYASGDPQDRCTANLLNLSLQMRCVLQIHTQLLRGAADVTGSALFRRARNRLATRLGCDITLTREGYDIGNLTFSNLLKSSAKGDNPSNLLGDTSEILVRTMVNCCEVNLDGWGQFLATELTACINPNRLESYLDHHRIETVRFDPVVRYTRTLHLRDPCLV